MGLIREFDLCRFTHGYTRMSTDPLIEKSDQQTLQLPVRLNLFQALGNNKIPIYVVTRRTRPSMFGSILRWSMNGCGPWG